MSDQAQTPIDCEECGQPLKFALADEQPPIDLNSADVTIDVKGYCTNLECSRYEESEWLNRAGTEGGANGGA